MQDSPVTDWTNIFSYQPGRSLYDTSWSIGASTFSVLPEGTTCYVSVRAYDNLLNWTTAQDVFYVLKDTSPPEVTDNQDNICAQQQSDVENCDMDFYDLPGTGSTLNQLQYTAAPYHETSTTGWSAIE